MGTELYAHMFPVRMGAVQNHVIVHGCHACKSAQAAASAVACKSHGRRMPISWIADRSSLLEQSCLLIAPSSKELEGVGSEMHHYSISTQLVPRAIHWVPRMGLVKLLWAMLQLLSCQAACHPVLTWGLCPDAHNE